MFRVLESPDVRSFAIVKIRERGNDKHFRNVVTNRRGAFAICSLRKIIDKDTGQTTSVPLRKGLYDVRISPRGFGVRWRGHWHYKGGTFIASPVLPSLDLTLQPPPSPPSSPPCATHICLMKRKQQSFHSFRMRGSRHPLQMRLLHYGNWWLTAQLRNPHRQARSFRGDGLYFIPKGDPDSAPQRLGTLGDHMVWDTKQQAWRKVPKTRLAPGQKVFVAMRVYCLDRGRRVPGRGQTYIAALPMPQSLYKRLRRGYRGLSSGIGGKAPLGSSVQSMVWGIRARGKGSLQGKGTQERAGGRGLHNKSPMGE